MRSSLLFACLALLLAASSLVAQRQAATQTDPHPTNTQPAENRTIGPLVASGWCVVQSRNTRPGSTSADDHHAPGCDIGLGVSLYTHNRLSVVSVLGTRTLGLGLALTVVKPTPAFPRVVALALGLVVEYDSGGIYRRVYPALGATMSFRGPK